MTVSYSKSFSANQWSRYFIKKVTEDNKYRQDTFTNGILMPVANYPPKK